MTIVRWDAVPVYVTVREIVLSVDVPPDRGLPIPGCGEPRIAFRTDAVCIERAQSIHRIKASSLGGLLNLSHYLNRATL